MRREGGGDRDARKKRPPLRIRSALSALCHARGIFPKGAIAGSTLLTVVERDAICRGKRRTHMNFEENPLIAAVRGEREFQAALSCPLETTFLLSETILDVSRHMRELHAVGKCGFVHIDLMEGIGKDACGMRFLAEAKVDGIISTRVNMIALAGEYRLKNVQRLFIVDSHSMETAEQTVKGAHPDMVEIMPGIAPEIISAMNRQLNVPIIAGGLIQTKRQVMSALQAGAAAVSTGKEKLWYI